MGEHFCDLVSMGWCQEAESSFFTALFSQRFYMSFQRFYMSFQIYFSNELNQTHSVSDKISKRVLAFESTDFYLAVAEGTDESLGKALDLAATIDVTLTSTQTETKGWTYLHYIVDRYT